MPSLHDLAATELLAAYRARSLSPVEVTRALLRHIDRWEPALHATYALDAEAAMAQAEASQARWLKGQPCGALDGVPVTIKENIATQGVPVPLGSAATELVPAAHDAPPAARLREAGAVIVCKTTMPDYGMLSSGVSSFHRLTRNPWDLHKNPGGSSAGAGAAAAAGYGPLHVGTDIGGSVRLPASWCGIFTLKPSLGRVPIHPPYAGRVAGPMTRTVADAALMMATLSRPDTRDTMSLPWQDIEWHEAELGLDGISRRGAAAGTQGSIPARLQPLRIGLWLDAGWGLPLAREVHDAVTAAARRFEGAGAIVEPLGPFTTRAMADGMDRFWRCRSWLDISAMSAERQARVLPYIVEWARGGAGLSGEQVFDAYRQMGAIRDATVAACRPFDFVLSPTSPVVTYAAEWASPTNDPARPLEHIGFTLPFNMSEQPAASVNCGYTKSGLPIGLQIAGARFDDLGVLQLSRAWEQMRPAQRGWPVPPSP